MPYNKITFSENLNYYLKIHGENQSDLCVLCGVSSSTASGWCNGTIMPRMDKVQKIADHFGCRLSDLVESHDFPKDDERQKHLEQLADEIRKGTRFLKNVADSTYNFYSSLKILSGLEESIPRDIIFRPDQSKVIEDKITNLISNFLKTATPQEKRTFWAQYDKIGMEFRKQMEDPSKTPYPTPEEIETYSELAGNLVSFYTSHTVAEGPQFSPAPQEGRDTIPAQDAPEPPPEGE